MDTKDASVQRLRRQVEAVSGIRLAGAPRTLLLDTPALLSSGGEVQASLVAKLDVLARHAGMQVVVLAPHAEEIGAALCDIPRLRITRSTEELQVDGPVLAILGERVALPPETFAWYVGPGEAREPFHGCRQDGPHGTNEILGLFGTALVQERAGVAFRAAGTGREIPRKSPFDGAILDGIATAMAHHPQRVEGLMRSTRAGADIDLDRETDSLIAAALPSVLASQHGNGAVAAAPPPSGPDEPNYWFFWQRDAGQVVLAMAHLAQATPDGSVRDSAQQFVARYVDFVERLPRQDGTRVADLGISRFTMEGKPIAGYGSPQKDGPAQTVLAVTSALGESARAYAVVGPYLDYLSRSIPGPSFDPWEFAVGEIFFADNLARRALRKGARLADAQGDDAAARRFESAEHEIERALEAFKDAETGYVLSGRDFLQPLLGVISHLDIDVVGSVLTGYDVHDPFLNVDDPSIARTMSVLEGVSAERWPVNVAWQKSGRPGMGMGRFPEDANDGIGSTGGNPWTFATLWAAQYYLRLVQRRDALGLETSHHDRAAMLDRVDGYQRFVLEHERPDALTEQIDGQTGKPRGAKGLAWAQASLIDTLLLRREVRRSNTWGPPSVP